MLFVQSSTVPYTMGVATEWRNYNYNTRSHHQLHYVVLRFGKYLNTAGSGTDNRASLAAGTAPVTWAWPGAVEGNATVGRRALGSNAAGNRGAGTGPGRLDKRPDVGQRAVAARGAVALVKGLPLPPASPGSGGDSGNEFGIDEFGSGEGKMGKAREGTRIAVTNEPVVAPGGETAGVVGMLGIANPAGSSGGETHVAFSTPVKADMKSAPGWLGQGANGESGHLTPFRNPCTPGKKSSDSACEEGGSGKSSTSVPPRPLRRYDVDYLAVVCGLCDVFKWPTLRFRVSCPKSPLTASHGVKGIRSMLHSTQVCRSHAS